MTEATRPPKGQQETPRFVAADFFTLVRLPLAAAFPIVQNAGTRLVILAVAGATDLLDGVLARRFGSSRFGPVIDPVADKLFAAAAFGVVLFSGKLAWYEVAGVLARDLVATVAFAITAIRGHAAAIPARAGGKAVTLLQLLTLIAFLLDSPLLRPLAWATAAVALYAIWDYVRVAPKAKRPV
jgi:phosphatidylglycerophosphate synthase